MTGDLVTLGSSEAAAALGLSPWQSPFALWCRLSGLTDRYAGGDSAVQARGRWLERPIADRYARAEGVALFPGPAIDEPGLPGPEPWMHDRPDFVAHEQGPGALTLRGVEVKTCRRFAADDGWGPIALARAPQHYLIQCIWHAVCLDVARADLVAYATIDEEHRTYPITPGERLRASIVARVRAWYQRHVVEGEPPSIDGHESTTAALAAIHAGPRLEHREATDLELDVIDRVRRARKATKTAKLAQTEAENELRALIGGDLGLAVAGERLATWSPVSGRRTVNRKALANVYPDIASDPRFLKIGAPSRRLNLKGESDDESDE